MIYPRLAGSFSYSKLISLSFCFLALFFLPTTLVKAQTNNFLKKHQTHLKFQQNQGQYAAYDVQYVAMSGQSNFNFRKESIQVGIDKETYAFEAPVKGNTNYSEEEELFFWEMNFINSTASAQLKGVDPKVENNEYILGSSGPSSIGNYNELWYKGLYKNIDMRFYSGGDGSVEYDFIVYPKGDYKEIKMEVNGLKGMEVDQDNNLILITPFGKLKTCKPYTYQNIKGKEVEVATSFHIVNGNTLAFKITSTFNPEFPLVIQSDILD